MTEESNAGATTTQAAVDTTGLLNDLAPLEAEDPTGPAPGAGVGRRLWLGTTRYRPVLVLTVAMFVFASIDQSQFLTNENIQNLLTAVAGMWIIAMGQTFCVLTGSADLSSGAIAAVISVMLAKTVGLPTGLAFALALIAGTVFGAIANGLLIGRFRLSFFVVTLATGTALGGIVTLWSGGDSFLYNHSLVNYLSIGRHLGVAGPIWLMAIVFLLALYVERRTYFGRNLFAVGGSLSAARLSGIRTDRTLVYVFGVSGFAAALAGVVETGLVGSVNPVVDPSIALTAIAAVLLGGTSLYGGAGSVVGTAFGVLFIAVLDNALNLAGVQTAWQSVVTGVILIAAVAAVPGAGLGSRSLGGTLIRKIRSRDVPVATNEPPVDGAFKK